MASLPQHGLKNKGKFRKWVNSEHSEPICGSDFSKIEWL